MKPGPFAAGCAGSNAEAAGDLHKILTSDGARGRLWDPDRSRQSNHRVDYADSAREFLTQRGLAHLLDAQHVRADEALGGPQNGAEVDLSPEEVSLRCIFSCEPLFKLGCQIGK